MSSETMTFILIRIGLSLVVAAPTIVYSILKKTYIMIPLTVVLCIAFSLIFNVIPFSLLASAFCFYLSINMFKKKQANAEKKNRVKYKEYTKQMDGEGVYFVPESKTGGVWPPVNNNIVDMDAVNDFMKDEQKDDK